MHITKCPCCRNEIAAVKDDYDCTWLIGCVGCGLRFECFTKAEAVKVWNAAAKSLRASLTAAWSEICRIQRRKTQAEQREAALP